MLKQGHNLHRRHKGTLSRFFGFGIPFLAMAIGAVSAPFSTTALAVNAQDASWTPCEKEELVEHTSLAVTATSSTLTATTQSISVSFRSQLTEAWGNGSNNMNVYVLPDDPAWENPGRIDGGDSTIEVKDEDYPHYPASVYNINTIIAKSAASRIVIPQTVRSLKRFVLDVHGISADCCFNPNTDQVSYEGITEIVIPATIDTIAEFSFANVPEDVTIYCEAPEYIVDEEGEFVLDEEGEKQLTYPGNWTDGNVVYDFELTDADKKLLTPNTPAGVKFGSGDDFFLGIESETYNYPLYIEYQYEKLDADGVNYDLVDGIHMQALPIVSTNNPYDGVGTTMGVTTIVKNVDVPVSGGLRVNAESIKFHNIYHATMEGTDIVPEVFDPEENDGWNGEYYALPTIAYTLVPHFDEFFSSSTGDFAFFGSFLRFSVNLEINPGSSGYGLYAELRPDMYSANKKLLESGQCQTRYQFSSLDQSYYTFTYEKDGALIEKTAKLGTPVKYVLVPGNTLFQMGFLVDIGSIDGLNLENLRKIDLCNFIIKTDIYDNETHSIVTRSSVALRFASLELFADAQEVSRTNVGLIILLTYLIYIVAFGLGAVGYYFFAKWRFRNDEFHRMNLKRYLKSAAKNFVGFALVVSGILFIICRWGLMNNTVVVYNPIDPLVTIFVILGAIFLGFFIRDLVIAIKNARKRREALRLRLDQDVEDDGTK